MDDGSLVVQAVMVCALHGYLVLRVRGWAREADAGTLLDRSDHELRQVRQWVVAGAPRRVLPRRRWLGAAFLLGAVALTGWLAVAHRWLDLASVAIVIVGGATWPLASRRYGPAVLEALGDRGLPVEETPLQREASERRRRWTRRWLLAAGLAAAVSVAAGVGTGSVEAGWPVWVAAVAGVLAVVAVGGAGWANTWVYGDERPVEG